MTSVVGSPSVLWSRALLAILSVAVFGCQEQRPEAARLPPEQGEEEAQAETLPGVQHEAEEGSAQKDARSDERLRRAAEQGDAKAQNSLGVRYDRGEGVPQDYAKAAQWYARAAAQGHAGAQYNLGLMYDKGRGVPQDYANALLWYRKAAEQGEPTAQYNLGVMYDKGRGVPQDYAKAVLWYRKAAEQGEPTAQYNLGLMYANGDGVPQDHGKTVLWWRKAAEQGYAPAQYNLGLAHVNGDGVPQDDADRYKFRTPSLRNTALTGPWGHGGAYNSLEAMVRHQLDPVTSLHDYDIGEAVLPSRTDLDAEDFVHMSDPDNVQAIADASEIQESIALSETEVAELIAFLHALTDPASLDLRTTVPISVPSGLRLAD